MVDNIAPPSQNPGDFGSFPGIFKLILTKFLQGVDDMLPAQVIAYDRAANIAQVRPLIAVVTQDGRQIDRAPIARVPVLQLGGGGFVLSFPIIPGDIGWIKANDRDISLFKQSLANTRPNTQRKHSFEDAIFIPDTMMRNVTLADNEGVCLQSIGGESSIVILPNEIIITAENVTINGLDFSTHIHTGVDPGGGNSDGPVNP